MTEIYFSQFWRPGSPRSRCRQIWRLVRGHFLVHRWPSSCCVLHIQRVGNQPSACIRILNSVLDDISLSYDKMMDNECCLGLK